MTSFASAQEVTATPPASQTPTGQDHPTSTRPPGKGRIGRIVAGSFFVGIVAALLLAGSPIIPATESSVTGALLLGFALGWALLAALSARFTDQPQTWAAAPALFLSVGGLLLLAFGAPMQEALAWVWPPAMLVLAAWMVAGIHRNLRSRSGRLVLYPVVATLVLASLGSGYETVYAAANTGADPTQGQLIDVGGHRLFLNCTGTGSPTVVLEPGAGLMSSDVSLIAPTVAQDTRVCVYDRAGRGRSDPVSTLQNGAEVATDLHTLLQRGNEPGPYVLAGHSFGGLYALSFAARYPDEVAGLVLIDSTPPARAAEPGSAEPAQADSTTTRISALGAALARLGVGRVDGVDRPSHLRGTIDEYLQAGTFARQAAELRDFGNKPLVVLTAGRGSRPGWGASQDALASLSTNSAHRIVNGSTHASLLADREDATTTAQGVLDVVSAVRTARPLAN